MLRLPKALTETLADARDWRIEPGTKHNKLFVNGRLAGILSKGSGRQNYRDNLNIKAQVKRIIRLTA